MTSQNQELEGAQFLTTMLAGVAGAAMLLAGDRIYGVTAYLPSNSGHATPPSAWRSARRLDRCGVSF